MIDGHAHVSDTDYGNASLLIKAMDKAGVSKAVIVPGGMMDVRKMTLYLLGDLEPSESIPNHVVYQAIKDYPDRLTGYVCINPLEDEAALEMFEEGIRQGCKGVKLNPMSHKFSFSGSILETIAERCGKHGMPIYTHTLYDPGASSQKFGELAGKFPGTNFIIGHMGFGPVDVYAMELARDLPNMYLETSLGSLIAIEEALRIAGPDKIIFGSEFPMSTPEIQAFQIGLLPEEVQRKILSENIKRIIPSLDN